jgi:hypothetical protein
MVGVMMINTDLVGVKIINTGMIKYKYSW